MKLSLRSRIMLLLGFNIIIFSVFSAIIMNMEFPQLSKLLLSIFLLLTIMILSFFFISSYITNPIRNLEKYIRILAKGDLNVRIPKALLKRKDEIGYAARSINIIRKSINNLSLNVIYQSNEIKENIELAYKKLNELDSIATEVATISNDIIAGIVETAEDVIERNGTSTEIQRSINALSKKSQKGSMSDKIIWRTRDMKNFTRISQWSVNDTYHKKDMWYSMDEGVAVENLSLLTEEIHNLSNNSKKMISELQSLSMDLLQTTNTLTQGSQNVSHLIHTQIYNNIESQNSLSLPKYHEAQSKQKTDRSRESEARRPSSVQPEVEETYRMLQLRITSIQTEECMKVVAVTSVIPFDRKSEHVYHIAKAFALDGKKVLIIDCNNQDLRILKYFGIKPDVSIDSIHNDREFFDHIFEIPQIDGLNIIPAGSLLNDAEGIINVDKIRELIEEVGDEYDNILIDSPPVGNTSAGIKLSLLADGTIITVQSGKTPKASAKKANDMLNAVNAKVVGVIFVND